MIRRQMTLTVNKFTGVNEGSDYDAGFPSDAEFMRNFCITDNYALKKRDGFEYFAQHSGRTIRSMTYLTLGSKKYLFYIAGDRLYKYDFVSSPSLVGVVGEGEAAIFRYGDFVYVLNGVNYYKTDGETISVVEGYVPTVLVSSSPNGDGTSYEDPNILTGKVKQLYSGDGTSAIFRLGIKGATGVNSVEVDGTVCDDFSFSSGSVTFSSPPPSGINNVCITYTVPSLNRSRITGCKRAVFCGGGNDTRLMVWGSDGEPDTCFYSELADGLTSVEYFPEHNSIKLAGHKISDILRHYDRQIIFTDRGAFYSYDSTVTDDMGVTRHVFPVFTLSSQKGNAAPGQAVIIDNCPVTLWSDGIYKWVSTNIRDERNAKHISSRVTKTFADYFSGSSLQNALMFDYEVRGELWVAVNQNVVLVYNYRLDVWYVYDDIPASCFCAVGDIVYFGTPDGKIARFGSEYKSNNGGAIGCVWKSPFFACGKPNRKKDLKTMTVILQGKRGDDIDVYWRSDDQIGDTLPVSVTASSNSGISVETLSLTIKRFNSAKLMILSDNMDSDAHLLSMSIIVKVLNK